MERNSIDQTTANHSQPNNPLHGKTLQAILTHLVDHYGWEEMYHKISVRCFYNNPSIKSSLKFFRKSPWDRQKLEEIYIELIRSSP